MEEKNQERQVPDLNLDEQQRIILPEIEVPILINGKEGKVTMKKLSAGVRRDVVKRHVTTKLVGSQISGNIDPLSMEIEILSKVIIKAPFPTQIKDLESLPDEVVDYLYQEYERYTGSVKKKRQE